MYLFRSRRDVTIEPPPSLFPPSKRKAARFRNVIRGELN